MGSRFNRQHYLPLAAFVIVLAMLAKYLLGNSGDPDVEVILPTHENAGLESEDSMHLPASEGLTPQLRGSDDPTSGRGVAFLKGYPDGDLILARLAEDGIDLEKLAPPSMTLEEALVASRQLVVPSEEQIASIKKQHIQWPDDGILSNAWLESYFGGAFEIDETTLLTWSAEFMEEEIELESSVDRYVDELNSAILDSYSRDQVELFPYTRPVDPMEQTERWKSKGGGFSSGGSMSSGWCCSVVLFRDDYPECANLLERIPVLRSARDHKLRQRIETWNKGRL